MTVRIPTAVLGATGYVGGELLRLVQAHPDFDLCAAISGSRAGEPVSNVFPHLAAMLPELAFTGRDGWTDRLDRGSQIALFSAAPHGASASMIADALERAEARDIAMHVVDVSADFRYANREAYEQVYGTPHGAPGLLEQFSSAVPEHAPEAATPHIGHPGCFATAVLLAVVPLIAAGLTDGDLYATGITGSTGSGREPQAGTHHPERHANLYAYKPLAHRHTPEITGLAAKACGRDARIHFVPHSGPFARGIYVTVQTRAEANTAQLVEAFEAAYRDAPFVDIVTGTPRLKNVVASNRAEIGVASGDGVVAVHCAIDNLVKGAAGGALQWMNRLFSLPDTAGLTAPAPGWL